MVSRLILVQVIKVRVPIQSSLLGDGVTGNTTHFDCVILGSNPSPPAKKGWITVKTKYRRVSVFGCGAMVAQRIVNSKVAGSSPATRAIQD